MNIGWQMLSEGDQIGLDDEQTALSIEQIQISLNKLN
jgi:hypothetical protein